MINLKAQKYNKIQELLAEKQLNIKHQDAYYVELGKIQFTVYANNEEKARKLAMETHLKRLRDGTARDKNSIFTEKDVKIISPAINGLELIDKRIKNQTETLNRVIKKAEADDFYKKLIDSNTKRLKELKSQRKEFVKLIDT